MKTINFSKSLQNILIIICFFILEKGYSQNVEPIIPKGHTAWITAIDVSPDSHYLASSSLDNSVVIWDIDSGSEIRSIPLSGKIASVAFIDNENIVSYSQQNEITFINIRNGLVTKNIQIDKFIFSNFRFNQFRMIPIYPLRLTPDRRYALVSDYSNQVKKIDLQTSSITSTFNTHTGYVNCIDVSSDGKYYLSGAEDKSFKVWNAKNETEYFAKNNLGSPVLSACFFNNSSSFIIGLENGEIQIINPELNTTDSLVNAWSDIPVWSLKITKDNKYLISGYKNGEIKIWDLFSKKVIKSFEENGVSPIVDLEIIQDNILFASASYDRTIKIYDINNPKSIKTFTGHTSPNSAFSYSRENNMLINSDSYGRIYFWDFFRAKLIKTIKAEPNGYIVDIDFQNTRKQFITASWLKNIKLWDVNSQKAIKKIHFEDTTSFVRFIPLTNLVVVGMSCNTTKNNINILSITDFSIVKSINTGKRLSCLNISPDGKLLVAGHKDETISIINLSDYSTIMKKFENLIVDGFYDIRFINSYQELIIANNGNLFNWNILNNSIEKYDVSGVHSFDISPDNKYIITASGNQFLKNTYNIKCWELKTKRLVFSIITETNVKFLRFIDNGNFIAGMEDMVKIFDLKSQSIICNFLAIGTEDWIAFTPDNYYYCSKDIARIMSFRGDNLKIFPFSQFDLQYNRPDIVLQRIGCANIELIEKYNLAYEKRLKKMNFTESMFKSDWHIPEIEIVNRNDIRMTTNNEQLKINLKIKDSIRVLDRINVWINNVPIYGSDGISLMEQESKMVDKKIGIQLSNGLNKIQISVLNNAGAESKKEIIETIYDPIEKRRPKLYLVSIGVSEYADREKNLKYAAKDACDLLNIYKGQNDLYESIDSITLLNKNVTLENIRMIKSKLLKSNINDQVLIFISGHGLYDKDLNYHLATYNTDFNNPTNQNSLPYGTLENILDGIPARNKILVMDACNSGELDKEAVKIVGDSHKEVEKKIFKSSETNIISSNNSLDLMKELFADFRNNTGSIVISSSSGLQYSIEGKEWGNGAFSHCLIDGLENKKADLNHDGQIMISELQQYVHDEVPKITNGEQQPTSRVENLINDFRVW